MTPHQDPVWLHRRTKKLSGWRDKEGKFHYDLDDKHPEIPVSPAEAKRTLRYIKESISPDKIFELIQNGKRWPYKTKQEFYEKRDKALLALIYLSGGRVNEVLRVEKKQFGFSDEDFILIHEFRISKRKERTIEKEGIPRIVVPLPRTDKFKKFTDLILDYYEVAPEHLFKIGRKRAWAIIKHMTGKWCHYFRSQRLSYLVNRLRSATVASKIVGIKNPQTITHYYKGTWEEYREELKK